tara:strand:+ start:760 stop:2832 length:2073 start_codon:yes stop_codon:yes gene_type:complete
MTENSPIRKSMRRYTADSFLRSLRDRDNLFLFVGRTTGWTAEGVFDGSEYTTHGGNTGGSSVFVHPLDTVNEDAKASRNIVAMKAINSSDIAYMVPRVNWLGSTQYVQYDHEIDLTDKRFYVMTDEFNVYKCISNNGNATTTNKPSSTKTSGLIETRDGFVWKFMYTIPEELRKFITTEFMPVPTVDSRGFDDVTQRQFDVQSNAVNGGLHFVELTSAQKSDNWEIAGNGHNLIDVGKYTLGDVAASGETTVTLNSQASSSNDAYNDMTIVFSKGLGAVQAHRITDYVGATKIATLQTPLTNPVSASTTYQIVPTLGISGDGVSAEGYLQFNDYSATSPNAKTLNKIVITNPGKNYTYASVNTIPASHGVASGAYAGFGGRATIAPKGGHGSNAVEELGATYLTILKRFEALENIPGLSGSNDLLQYGIIRNPILNDTDSQYLDSDGNPVRLASTQTDVVKQMKIESNLTTGDGLAEGLFSVGNIIVGSDTKSTGEITAYQPSNESGFGVLKIKNTRGDFEEPYSFGFTGEAISELKYDSSTKVWSVISNEKARVVGVEEPARDQTQITFRSATVLGISADTEQQPLTLLKVPHDSIVVGNDGTYATVFHVENSVTSGASADIVLIDQRGTFATGDVVGISGGVARFGVINTVVNPEIKYNTGEIVYIQNMNPLVKGFEQMEEYQILLGF